MSEDSEIDVNDLKEVDEGEEILSIKEMLMHYPVIKDIVQFIPDELLEMLITPLRMMSPIYTLMYSFEHMLEMFIEPFLLGTTREQSDDPMMRCMEGRYNLFMQKWLKPFMSMVPFGGELFDLFLQLHRVWIKYCPTYLMMSIVSPTEFAKRKYWDNFPEPNIEDLPILKDIVKFIPCFGSSQSSQSGMKLPCASGCSSFGCPFSK